ncbi:MAG TPA: ABC transporter permease [Candidatus Atribacteria bacterium]|nr:ABC transporter permease [Candidatus Atribacteria bacterium]HPT77970.1 ABC transporter permease [Candidatus Atribacteria bacterium]
MKQYRWLAYPYAVWMIIFIVVPLMLVLFFSVTAKAPDGSIVLTLENFKKFWEPMYINVLIRSVLLAVYSTVICLVLGYPLALILAGRDFKRKNILVMLAVIPMWMNFLLRTYSWMTLLEKNGTINAFFGTLERLAATYLNMELTLPRVNILYTETAVILGMVYNFLPFMILPIYSVVSKLDRSLIEAAQDLGGNNLVVFKRVIFPLSLPGVLSGITMVFMPAVTTFVISRLLGGAQFMLIGNLIERQFLFSNDWGFGSALSIIMLLLILLSMGFMSRYEKENSGGGLW